MRHALPLCGLIALAFGAGSSYATGETGLFGVVNLVLGAVALALGALLALRRLRGIGAPEARRLVLPRLALLAATIAAAVALERVAARSQLRFDGTADARFELFPATRETLAGLGPQRLRATLFQDRADPRARRTRLLLDRMAEVGPVEVHQRFFEEAEDEIDRFGVTATNSVVLELADRHETVDRPTEGSLLQAIQRLRGAETRVLYTAIGEGEGDLSSGEPTGYTGLAAALQAEGYEIRGLVLAAVESLPSDAAGLLVVGPQRTLRTESAAALRRYLDEAGGRLVALLEPGVESGLEELLGDFGFALPGGVIVDPASGPVEGAPAGVNPILGAYAAHPVTRGLEPRTMTFFLRARPVIAARKPAPDDALASLVFTSPRAWLASNVEDVQRGRPPQRDAQTQEQRFPLAAAGAYPRPGGEARIVAFGDADFATNQYLRSLYNLDLLVNAIHWALAREVAITLRPKEITPAQDPLTPQQTLTMFYGVGLLLPELLLLAAALAWARRRES